MQPAVSLHQAQRAAARRQTWGGVRLLLPIVLTLLLGVLAYQMPLHARIDVGQLGDQLFLPSSEAQRQDQIDAGAWYADQLDQDGVSRSRWSRERATITVPGLGNGRAVQLTLIAAGWPANVVRGDPKQPTVEIRAGDRLIDRFTPTSEAAPYSFTLPPNLHENLTLQITPTFTDTATSVDRRPKGIRLDAIELDAAGFFVQPDWRVLGGLLLATMISLGVAHNRSRRAWLPVIVGVGVALLGATLIVVARIWLAALLPAALIGLAAVWLLLNWRWFARLAGGIAWRMRASSALNGGLLAALLALCAYLLARLISGNVAWNDLAIADSSDRWLKLLLGVSLLSGVGMLIVASLTVLPEWVLNLRRALLTTRLAAIVLALLAGIWIGYETWLIFTVPIVGHADYADNAVVARNLVRGRGWIVDYVTQFYNLVPGGSVTRVQETWPLLQPLLIAPFMALLGPTSFAARLPNIGFMLVLTALIFHIGSRMWDRRVGCLGALLTLGNLYFFRLALYATSDLALVVWSMTAFWLVFQALENQEPRIKNQESRTSNQGKRSAARRSVLGSQFSALGARRSALGARRSALGSQFSALGSQFSVLSSRRSALGARFSVLGARFSVLGSWFFAGVFTGLMILQKPSAAIFAVGMGLWVLWALERRRRAARMSVREVLPWLRPVILWTALTLLVIAPFLLRNLHEFRRPFFSTEAWDAWILYFRGTGDEAWDDIYRVYAPEFYQQFVPGQSGPGLPDRSWILRWGYDLTINKIVQQASDAWTFFAPPKGKLLNYDTDGIALTWLLLLGLVALSKRQRALIALVVAALVPYTTFLILYWHTHYEERYFVPFIPWLALVAAWGACWLFDRIAAIGRGRWAGLAGLAVSLALIGGMLPHYREIDAELDPRNRSYWGVEWQADLDAFEWLKRNTPADAVIMSRVPWQLNFYADRAGVMVPNADYTTIMEIARYYDADYLVLGLLSTPQAQRPGGAFAELAKGAVLPGWAAPEYDQTYQYGENVQRRVLVYRIPKQQVRGQQSVAGNN